MFSKCSTKCLIAFTICAIALVVLSSIFMAIVTTSVLVRSSSSHSSSDLMSHRELLRKNLEKYLMGSGGGGGGGSAGTGGANEPTASFDINDPNISPNNYPHPQPPPNPNAAVDSSHSLSENIPPQLINNPLVSLGDSTSTSSGGSTNSKLEQRNVFSWITDTIKKSFMSSGDTKKSAAHASPNSFASLFDANGELLLNAAANGDYSSVSGNPNFDQILELSRRFRLDGNNFQEFWVRVSTNPRL